MKRVARVSVAALMAVVLVGLTGCYREVISAEGITADAHHPRKAKSSETNIDKAIDDLFKEKDN